MFDFSASADAERGTLEVVVQHFTVPYAYPVVFTKHLFSPDNPVLADVLAGGLATPQFARPGALMRPAKPTRSARCVVFADGGVLAGWAELPQLIAGYFAAHDERLALCAPPELLPGGEACKNDPGLVERLQRRLVSLGVDRHAFVIAIGGGAVLDLVGWVAASTHRGIRHVRVPTTVLAQNDSGVGVKNAVNAFGQKNLLGAFAPPFAVLNDAAFLDRLPERERRVGMAEAVKVALIRDGAFFQWLELNADRLARFEQEPLANLIRRCAELHMRQIADGGDPFETGSSRPLDFGHWAAHRLEVLSEHRLRHGEAVAIGIALDSRYSVLCGLLPAGDDVRICRLLEALGFSLWHPALDERDETGALAVLRGLDEFREHLGGDLTVTLLSALGRGVDVHWMDADLIASAIGWLRGGAEHASS